MDTVATAPAAVRSESSSWRHYDAELLEEIRRIGFHPFILVRVRRSAGGGRLVACHTQNDAGGFVAELASLPELAGSKLLRGIERALQLEIYEAADLLFGWTQEPSGATEA